MFLQLLVAQLQNQDPTSPVDPSQFVGQLAQFSELSEVTSIYQLLQQVVPGSTGTGSSGSGSGSPASGSGGNATSNPPSISGNNATSGTASLAASTASGSALLPGGVSPTVPLPNFSSPTISQLTSKIQGAF